MAAITKFARLPLSEKLLVMRAAVALAAVRTGLAVFGFAAVRRVTSAQPRTSSAWCLTNSAARQRNVSKHPPSAETIVSAIEAASGRIPGGRNCLVRALAAEYLLHRYSYRCELRIGAKRDENGRFAAHAWLECDGRVLIGEFELDSYARFAPTSPSQAESHT